MEKAILLLGSNEGEREERLQQAVENIANQIGDITSLSNIYQSEAVGYESSSLYLNQVIVVQTDLEPFELLACTQQIENLLGRVRSKTERYTDRTIDIDILFYGDRIIDSETLTIPHPLIAEREFVLRPLMDIESTMKHPQTGVKIEEMWRKFKYF